MTEWDKSVDLLIVGSGGVEWWQRWRRLMPDSNRW